jgi:hypothetical protein
MSADQLVRRMAVQRADSWDCLMADQWGVRKVEMRDVTMADWRVVHSADSWVEKMVVSSVVL